ncbi:MAG: metallophosphoesterase family protein [Balneolaceae bacterium]
MADPGKYVAIGDIHGCAKSNQELLEKLDEQVGLERKYIFLGDYTDRGPDSKLVIDQLLEFGEKHECIFLRGNHDQMLLDAYEKNEWDLWLRNGGSTTLDNYNSSPGGFDLPAAHYNFFKETILWWETEAYFFVHGGISPDLTIQENLNNEYERNQFLWQREHIYASDKPWEKIVVFGHTPVKEPVIEGKMIGIDTGCVFKKNGYGILTAVVLPEVKLIQQECLDF